MVTGRCENSPAGRSMPRFWNLSRKIGRSPVELEPPVDRAVGRERVDLELEDVLHRDHVRLHPLDLHDRRHAPRAVLEALDVDDHVERGGHLLADRPHGQVVAGHQDHRLDAGQGVAGAVRVDGRQRPVVARVHRLEHVERLGAAALADDDPVGPHAQGVADEVADRDRALALDVRRARLEPEHVALVELELGRVLDRHDPLVVRDRGREPVEERRLPRAGAARDQDVELRLDAAPQEVDRVLGQRAEVDHVLRGRGACFANFRIVRSGPESESGAITALTREPSRRRASTIGEDSSMRRPTWATIRLMIRRRCESSLNRTVVS